MTSTFGSGELTLSLAQQALGSALEVDWLRVRTFKGADLCAVGATGVAVGSDFTILGGESHLFGKCDLAEVFAIGSNVTDKLFYAYASVAGWISSGEQAVDVAIKTSAGQLHGILIETDGTDNVSAQLWDDTDAAEGTALTPLITVAGGDRYGGVMGIDVGFSVGCYLTLAGAGVENAIVYYR